MKEESFMKFHKFSDDRRYYIIRGNIIDLQDIVDIVPEYHNNKRSLYLKVIKNNGKNIIKMTNKVEYNLIIEIFNRELNRNDLKYI